MAQVIMELTRGDRFVPFLIFTGIILIVGMKTIGSAIRSVARERTRREIAAYIAEGSMSPEQGERLMRAGGGGGSGNGGGGVSGGCDGSRAC